MRPIAELANQEARSIRAVLFDLDDTLLTDGRLTRAAFNALCDLSDARVDLVAVTGRAAGWGEVIARQWPLLGVVAENGGILFWRDDTTGRLVRSRRIESVDQRRCPRLAAIVASICSECAPMNLADDNDARLTDVTFDVGEYVAIDRERVARARAIVERAGARCTVSSVHLHATFEGDDKASGALRMLRERRGVDAAVARSSAAFIGDSGNDAACFSCFQTTVGVANIARHVPGLTIAPRYVTVGEKDAGFVEFANHLLRTR